MVPQRWFTTMKMENGPKPLISAIHVDELDADQIMTRSRRHPGVRRTTYFVRRICPATPRAAVKMAIRTCEECQSIDPAPVHWEKGTLAEGRNGHYALWCPPFPNAHRLLSIMFLNLKASGKTRPCKCDLPAGDGVF